ncbi:hypothetical protein O0I10_008767 [Lichtheimia ornata]|uniref:Uncharacterized protein n=1 Tax=Lichtheimia ornata TaxID=688661 RepID=A0AAD7V0H0_9FUNG|nr:uncharacterized protein O0I10_008767 [Lichtheimia ornata]KAJ8655481.1 hypothetical protein O0I10_008767 [Lichtheimia ornata]
MPSAANLYKILGVSENATQMEIRQAYMEKAAKYHPDRNPEGGDKFIEVATAYNILSDKDRLKAYKDEKEEDTFYRADQTDVFEQVTTAFAEEIRSRMDAKRLKENIREADLGLNVRTIVAVTLNELYNGAEKQVDYRRMIVCRDCQGSRFTFQDDKCLTCSGQGKVKRNRKKKNRYVACERCRGSGKIKVRKSCTVCNGLRYTESKESATIIIPKGGPRTGKICLTNKGHETHGPRPRRQMSHVIVGINLIGHRDFKLHHNQRDLITCVPITLSEALLGFDKVLLTHLDGRKIKVSNPAGNVIDPSSKKYIRGEGMPIAYDSSRKGDLIILFDVQFPRKLVLSPSKQDQLVSILNQQQDTSTVPFERVSHGGNDSYRPTTASSSSSSDAGIVHERALVDDTTNDHIHPLSDPGFCGHCNTKPLFDENEMFGEKQQPHHESRLSLDLFLDMIGVHGPYDDDEFDDEDDEEEEFFI